MMIIMMIIMIILMIIIMIIIIVIIIISSSSSSSSRYYLINRPCIGIISPSPTTSPALLTKGFTWPSLSMYKSEQSGYFRKMSSIAYLKLLEPPIKCREDARRISTSLWLWLWLWLWLVKRGDEEWNGYLLRRV